MKKKTLKYFFLKIIIQTVFWRISFQVINQHCPGSSHENEVDSGDEVDCDPKSHIKFLCSSYSSDVILEKWLLLLLNKWRWINLFLNPNHPQTIQTPTAGFVVFWWTQYCIAQTGILCMGPGVPILSRVQQLCGSVCAWCWILADWGRFFAKITREIGLKKSMST